jgi:O-antigen ligase
MKELFNLMASGFGTMTGTKFSALRNSGDETSDEVKVEKLPASGRWAERTLLFGLMLFAMAIPHSIAGAYFALGLSLSAWLARNLATRRFHFRRTPLDWPLLCFAGLTVLSSLFSEERGVSLPKLKGLIVFGVIYLVAAGVRKREARLLLALLIVSGLTGVAWSLIEKNIGRGMIVTEIHADSPLVGSSLQKGDVISFIGRDRVRSLEGAAKIIRRHPAGKRLEIEALHSGDPMQLELLVTDELKARSNPLGLSASGSSRRFRVSGFSRHFITYADQMQLLALLCYGFMLVLLRKAGLRGRQLIIAGAAFSLFTLALILTSTRAAIASFLLALLIVSVLTGGKRMMLAAIALSLLLGVAAWYALISTRAVTTGSFIDDSSARRIGYMRAGLKLIPQHPLLGVGMDAHKLHWQEWGFPGDYITHTHSTPIQLALDRGLPALVCFVWLMAMMTVTAWRGAWNQDIFSSGLSLGVSGALVGFCAGSLVNYNFGDSEIVMLLLFVWTLAFVAQNKNT